jgi:hypothetical protein
MSGPRSTRSELFGAITAGLIVVGFCFLFLWHNPRFFWNDDYELSILPVFADVARSWNQGHLPLLSPYSWVCNNLAGEFQYGTFSIFINVAVVLIWKFPLTFSQQAAALSITHLFVLAAGAFLLAYDRLRVNTRAGATLTGRLRRPRLPGGEGNPSLSPIPLSIFVALVAALNGWIICWGATDWFGALGAFAWLPWAWWSLERSLATGRNSALPYRKRLMIGALWPAPFVYLVVTGGFPYTVLMLALLIVWLSIKTLSRYAEAAPISSIAPMLLGVALGLGLSAPAWLAIFDYVRGSARQMEPSSMHFQWLVPPAALPGLILPCWTVRWADFSTRYLPHTGAELACGLVPPAALIAGLLRQGRLLFRRIKWELVLLLVALLLSMIPTVSVFRWSFRWLPFFHLVLALCAAEALQSGIGFEPMFTGRMPLPRTSFVALILAVTTAITMSIFHVGGPFEFPLTWILLGLTGIWLLAEFLLPNESLRAWLPAGVTFAALLATYLCIPTYTAVPRFNFSQELLKPAPLDPQRLYLSIYPPPETDYRVEAEPEPVGQVVRPGSTSMWGRVHLVNGYSPISAAGVAREFKFATHGEIDPTVAESLLGDEAGRDGLLARLGVDGIIVAGAMDMAPMPESEWQLVFSSDEGRVYHRVGAPLARVRSVPSIDTRPGEQFTSATISRINESRNCVTADVAVPAGGSPALLTFSRPYFRGYEARLGNRKLRAASYDGLFPTAEVPAGSHGRLVLTYRPGWLIYGGAVAMVSCTIWILGIVIAFRKLRR